MIKLSAFWKSLSLYYKYFVTIINNIFPYTYCYYYYYYYFFFFLIFSCERCKFYVMRKVNKMKWKKKSYLARKSKKRKNSHTGISDLFKVTGNVSAADISVVNAELENFTKKKEIGTRYAVLTYLLVWKRKCENMHNAAEQKLLLIAWNQSTHNTLLYVLLSTVGNVISITRRKLCHHRSSINMGNLILSEMTCCKRRKK